MLPKNIYTISNIPDISQDEAFETILKGKDIKIERIISNGHTTEDNKWYDQKTDEWVLLLQGHAIIEFINNEKNELIPGDYIFIPAGKKHRVIYTSKNPHCLWLAIHVKPE
ncbi:MAG: cupin domain-containing protein [Bacteroidales bacterium]